MLGQHRQVRGRAAGAKSTRGWAKAKPKTKGAREALRRRCGAGAFLDSKHLKYPVVPAKAIGTGSCRPDCRALRAALSRASAQHKRKIATAARRKARRVGCKWAR